MLNLKTEACWEIMWNEEEAKMLWNWTFVQMYLFKMYTFYLLCALMHTDDVYSIFIDKFCLCLTALMSDLWAD